MVCIAGMAMQRFQMMLDDQLDAALAQRAAQVSRFQGRAAADVRPRTPVGRAAGTRRPRSAAVGSDGGADLLDDEYAGSVSQHVDDVLYGPAAAPRSAR
ncbi:MAG: hypothetical protein H0V19_04060 [Euzebyales bacterium]|nr:hypothetical protein [Euzebyales bacterium]